MMEVATPRRQPAFIGRKTFGTAGSAGAALELNRRPEA
jgi:hypothetical protein